ncbi:FxsA family protein [Anaerobiospirillum succiniciproducens]|uniref:FxsA family protein n=1 Tax=Anaerobiospirillum succiniciproducens TaxID=13335 RepID=UPI0023526F86|nr:FxsA family protein [Anaerobiospirillum succiniciproducens]MCI6863757.1 FxsA family protein [Anaerobiospirillum succiniciproducens]
MPLLVIFFLWFALEIYAFVLVGDALGYLAAIFLIFAIGYIGVAITRKVLAHDLKVLHFAMQILMNTGAGDESDPLFKKVMSTIENTDASARGAFISSLRMRCLKDQGIIALFVIPGFITDAFALLFLLLSLKSGLVEGMFSGKVFEKASVFGFASKGTDPYGKSARDLEKEAEAFAKEQQGNIPTMRPDAGKATVEEMKSRFQAEKEIKDAKFEEIKDHE